MFTPVRPRTRYNLVDVSRRMSRADRKRSARLRGKVLGLPRRFKRAERAAANLDVGAPSLPDTPAATCATRVTCIDYCPANVRFEEIADLQRFMSAHRPE